MRNKISFPVTYNNEAKFYFDGKEYNDSYVELLRKSKESIILQTYIFELDHFGKRVFDELIKASERGVNVFLLVDSVGTNSFSKEILDQLARAGVTFSKFNKINFLNAGEWGRRLHHKVLLIDGDCGIIGGINVISASSTEYEFPRLDFAIFLKGSVIEKVTAYCLKIIKKQKIKNRVIDSTFEGNIKVRVRVNDWVYHRRSISLQYTKLVKEANEEITIINSYFFPRRKFLKELVAAAKRGVRVRLILPRYSDWQSHVLAAEYFYDYLLKNGVEIYQWERSILHGKMAIIDRKYSMLGSFNLHYTSFQGNLEMNVEILSQDFSKELAILIDEHVLYKCQQVSNLDFVEKPFSFLRLKRIFYYLIISTVSSFSLGFIHQEDLDEQEPKADYFSSLKIVMSFFIFCLGLIGLILPVIPGLLLIVFAFLLVYPQIIKNYKNL